MRDVLGGFAEVALACCLHAIGAGAEIDAVEIKLENFGLGVLALQPERQFDFLQFALEGALLGQEQVLGQLLGERRAALRHAAMQDVGDRRAQNAPGVDAEMRIEAPVLDGDERLRQIRRQILQRDIAAGHFAANGEHAAIGAGDLDRRRPFRDFERLDRGQMRADPDDEADRGNRAPEAEHRTPIEQPADRKTLARLRPPLGAAAACARLALAAAASSSTSSSLRLGRFFRLVLPPGTRSRATAADRKAPQQGRIRGSLRPPPFFRPHAIRQNARANRSSHGSGTGLKPS